MAIKLCNLMQIMTVFCLLIFWQCSAQNVTEPNKTIVVEEKVPTETVSVVTIKEKETLLPKNKSVTLAVEDFDAYLPLLKGKTVGVVTNQTGIIPSKNNQHLVDFLLENNIKIKTIFAPEHGFRGKADAGELVKDGKDTKTGLPIISLYGKNKKPYPSQIKNLDLLLFDIQDVGVRFYTYISTLAYVMEAAAEQGKAVIVLDRPNPNRNYVDGPMREEKFTSFVGLHPVPVVYGMTMGEYAKMVNGEGWLKGGIKADLTVIPLKNYKPEDSYDLPVRPSPNLPNWKSINLYPSLCFFEGTDISVGRGTEMQFQIYGSPYLKPSYFFFTPKPNFGAKSPKHNGKNSFGEDLRDIDPLNKIKLTWLIKAYKQYKKKPFFNKNLFFDKLAGTDKLRKQIIQGKTEKEIKASWQEDLDAFKKIRAKYLLY